MVGFAPGGGDPGAVGVSTGGNTAGDTGTRLLGTLVLAGDNITLSQSTAGRALTVTISGGAGGGAAFSGGLSDIGNTAGDTGLASRRLVLAGGNNITLSGSTNGASMTVTVSAANETQTVPPIATAVKVDVSTVASTGTITRFAPEDHQHRGVNSAGVSNLGNTAGDTAVLPGRVVLVGGNLITLSQATDATGRTVSIVGANETQTVPPIGTSVEAVASASSAGTVTRFAPEDHRHAGVFSVGVSNVGNTAGDTIVTVGRWVLAGGNNVTLSVGTAANRLHTVTISAANETQTVPPIGTSVEAVASASSVGTVTRFAPEDHRHAGVFSMGVSNVGNTAGDTIVTVGRWVLAGGNNVTLSVGTAANRLHTVTISAANETQTVPPIATAVKVAVSTVASTGTITRFAPEDHQHMGVNSGGVSGGNTAGDTGVNPGRLVLAGGNNVTLSQGTDATGSTVTISAFNQTAPVVSNAIQPVSSETGSGTNTSRFAADDHVHRGVYSMGVSDGGNTAGDTGVNAGRVVLVGGNQITLSVGTAAGRLQTITISGPNPGAAAVTFGMSNLGNTASETGTVNQQFIVVGGDGIIGSQNVDGASATLSLVNSWSTATTASVVASANVVGADAGRYAQEGHQHAGVFSAGVSDGGNTAGDTRVGAGRFVLAGINGVTLSQATAANALNTVSVVGASTLSYFNNLLQTTAQPATSNATLLVQPLLPPTGMFPGVMTATQLLLNFSGSGTSNASTAAYTMTCSVGLYTTSGSTLSLLNSASTTLGTGGATNNVSTQYQGLRWLSFHSSLFSTSLTFAPKEYYIAVWLRSSGQAKLISINGMNIGASLVRSGTMGGNTSTNSTYGAGLGFGGIYSVSFSTAMPASIAATDIFRNNVDIGRFIPHVVLDNIGL